MVSDREVPPVGKKGVGRIAEHFAQVGRMFDAGIKVGVIAWLHGKQHGHFINRNNAVLSSSFIISQRGIVLEAGAKLRFCRYRQ